MEKLTDYWVDNDIATDIFKNAYQFNFIYEIQKKFLTPKFLREEIYNIFKQQELINLGKFWTIYNTKSKCLIDNQKIISSGFDLNDVGEKLGQQTISGTGDSFTESQANFISLLELIERFSFTLGKYYFDFESCFALSYPKKIISRKAIPMSTTGFALETTPKRAIEKAICESLERDAYLCHWYTQKSPTRLVLSDDPLFLAVSQAAKKYNLNFFLYKLNSYSQNMPTVLLAVIIDTKNNYPINFFCTGLSCDFSFRRCFLKAVFELNRFVRLAFQTLAHHPSPIIDITTPMGRFYYYQKKDYFPYLKIFYNPVETLTLTSDNANKKFSIKRSLFKQQVLHNFKEIYVYPGSVPHKLINKLFTCWVDIPELQPLDYETKPVINFSRILNFIGSNNIILNKHIHPLP